MCIPGVGSDVIRIAVHLSSHNITKILQPEEFPRFCRLEVHLLQRQLLWATIDAQCEAIWRLVAAPSSVENLTVNFDVPMLRISTYGGAQLAAALKTPGIALRHITLRGTLMRDVASAVVAMCSQLETLRLVELDPFLWNALNRKRLSTDKVEITCRRFQFSLVGFIPPCFSAGELLEAWDRLFGDPGLRRIVVSGFRSSCDWPSIKMLEEPPPPVMVPGRRVTIELRDRMCRDNNVFNWNAIGWLKRLAGTATEVEFHIDAASPYVSGLLGVTDRPSTPWSQATLHLAVLNWSLIWQTDDTVNKITRFLNLIAPTMSEWMTAQRNDNMATQMKVYAHLDDDVLPNIANDILMTLLQCAVESWDNEQYAAIRLWLQSHDILRLVRGPLTPLE